MQNYSISNVYKDVEQILKRPLNNFEFQKINYWIERYELDYIDFAITQMKNMPNIYSTNYIDSYLFRNYEMYKSIKQSILNSSPQPQVKEDENCVAEEETKQDDNMCNEVGWEGCTKDEQAYLIAKFKYLMYPDEYPEPTKPN